MNFFHKIFSIQEGTDKANTIKAISDGVNLKGYNIWILICSAMLASIGLDTNSTAVIIGAMLISPLMSPILGVGLSIAIHDKELLFRSVRNLTIAVIMSLATSVFFFSVTPLKDVTQELEARTYPTLLDVLVALFGGIAGIVSSSRKEKSNAIPGVAIATALMPPLCTAGYGIATGSWSYFLGAFYLFFINAVFISLATFIIVKYLRFPEKEYVDKSAQKLYSRWFTALALIVVLPSIYFLYTVYQKESAKKKIQTLVLDRIQADGNEILKWELQQTDTATMIKVYNSGNAITQQEIFSIDSSLQKHGLSNMKLKVFRVNFTKDEISNLTAEAARQALNEIQLASIKEKPTPALKDSLVILNDVAGKEISIAFPFIDTIQSGIFITSLPNRKTDTIPAFFYRSKKALTNAQQDQLYRYFIARSDKDTLLLMPIRK